MSGPVDWRYAQARLQARHGERLSDAEWRMLEAARSFELCLERSRSTPLRRFADPVNGRVITGHSIERVLRIEWRRYVSDVAAWAPPAWRPIVLWGAHVPDLVVLDRIFAGETRDWMREDPAFGQIFGAEGRLDVAALEHSPFRPLAPAIGRDIGVAECWLGHWRALRPRGCGADRRELEELAELVREHIGGLARAAAGETSGPRRRELADALRRMFRRRSGTPVAAFCHLAFMALDLERLRGLLLRARLFGARAREGA
jgi:hypothetical protein